MAGRWSVAALRRANRPWRLLTCSLSRATASARVPLGRVEEVQRVLAARGEVLGDQVHVAGLDAGHPRLAQAGAGRVEQEVEPVAGDRQASLADAGMAGLVLTATVSLLVATPWNRNSSISRSRLRTSQA